MFLPFHLQPDWLPAHLAAELLDFAISNESLFRQAKVGHADAAIVDESIRKSSVLKNIRPYSSALKEFTLTETPLLAKRFGMPAFDVSSVEIELAAHGDGAHFQPHIDTAVSECMLPNPRMLSLVLYLHRQPKGFSGGALRFHAIGGTSVRDLAPEHNLLIAFPSIARHSVEPVICPSQKFSDRRFAINIWIHR